MWNPGKHWGGLTKKEWSKAWSCQPLGSPTSPTSALLEPYQPPRDVATFELATYSRQALCRPVTNYFPYLSCTEHCVKEHVLALKHILYVLVRDSDYCKKSGSTKSKIGKHSWTCREGGISNKSLAMFELTRPGRVLDMIWPTPLLSVSPIFSSVSSHQGWSARRGGRKGHSELGAHLNNWMHSWSSGFSGYNKWHGIPWFDLSLYPPYFCFTSRRLKSTNSLCQELSWVKIVGQNIRQRDCVTGMAIKQTWLSLDKKQG